jgi:hypothetical protein
VAELRCVQLSGAQVVDKPQVEREGLVVSVAEVTAAKVVMGLCLVAPPVEVVAAVQVGIPGQVAQELIM